MAPNPISVTDALSYARAAGFYDEMRFLSVMREADAVFLDWVGDNLSKENGRHSKTRGRG